MWCRLRGASHRTIGISRICPPANSLSGTTINRIGGAAIGKCRPHRVVSELGVWRCSRSRCSLQCRQTGTLGDDPRRLKEFPTALEMIGSKPLPLTKEVSLRLGSRPLSFGTVAAHADESVRGDEVALWISGGRAGRFKDWLSLLKLGVALR